MTDTVVVIEAPGKVAPIERILRSIGFTFSTVIASRGRLFDLPRDRLGVDPARPENAQWEAIDSRRAHYIGRRLSRAESIVVMTDNDAEGELIAHQLQRLAPNRPHMRVRSDALTEEAIDRALQDGGRIDETLVAFALARRQFDRLTGYCLSAHTRTPWAPPGTNESVGRILTPLLASIAREPLERSLGVRPIDQQRHWHATMRLGSNADDSLYSALGALPSVTVSPDGEPTDESERPWRFEQAVLGVSQATGASLVDVSQALQGLYERGAISYPRTDSSRIGNASSHALARMAAGLGLVGEFDPEALVKNSRTQSGRTNRAAAHEGIHPLGERDLPSAARICSLSLEERTRQIITSQVMRCGTRLPRQLQPGMHCAQDDASAAWHALLRVPGASIDICRVVEEDRRGSGQTIACMPFFDDPVISRKPARVLNGVRIHDHTPEHSVLLRLLSMDIGRPSTAIAHVRKVVSRYLDAETFTLNRRGVEACHRANLVAPSLADPGVAKTIESALAAPGSVAERIRRALDAAQLDPAHLGEKRMPARASSAAPAGRSTPARSGG